MKAPTFFLLNLCITFLLFNNCRAQLSISGTVTDSAGRSLSNVTVSVVAKASKAVKGFAITDAKGGFAITIGQQEEFFIRATSIGYKPFEKPMAANTFRYTIVLTKGNFELPEIKVKSQVKLFNRGDTLNYIVQQFVRPQDRTIGDVIKNLPGITVSPTGTIIYNGKPINKFYIDGDDLLGDKYVLGSNTIPADVVSTVQVLENHQPVKMLENNVSSDNAALNIKLKSSAKLRVFGSGTVSTGLPFNSTDARINLLSFKKKIKFINSYLFNSVGSDLSYEVLSQNTGNTPVVEQVANTTRPLLGFTKLPDPILPNRYFVNNQSHLITTNSLFPLSKDKSLRLNAYWLPDKNTFDTRNTNTIFLPTDTIRQEETQISKIKRQTFFVGLTYLVNAKEQYLQNQLVFERNNTNGRSQLTTEINNMWQGLQSSTTKLQNTFLLKRLLRKNATFELNADLKYIELPETLNIEQGIYAWLINAGTAYNATIQSGMQITRSANIEAKVSKKVKKITGGISGAYLAESFSTGSWLDLLQTNNEIKRAGNNFQNDFTMLHQRATAVPSVEYKTKGALFQIGVPVLYRRIQYSNNNYFSDTTAERVSWHPYIKSNIELGKFSRVLVGWHRETGFTPYNNLLEGGILQNYRNLSQNLQRLQFTDANTYTLSYNFRKPIKITFFNTSIIYSRNFSPIITQQQFNLGLIQNGQQFLSNITKRLMWFVNYSKYIFPLKTTVKVGYNFTALNYFQVQNNEINNLRNSSHNANLTVIAKPKWYFNTELSINYLRSAAQNLSFSKAVGPPINLFTAGLIATYNLSEQTYVQIDANYLFQQVNSANKLLLADFRFNHTIAKSKTDIGLRFINIFNEKRFFVTNISGQQTASNDYWLRPFTVMASASFRF